MYDYEANREKLHASNGNKLTTGLFAELIREDVSAATPVFKLSDWHKRYVEIADPTGYEAAMELIGNWEHWLLLCKAPSFAAEKAKWDAEVEAKLRSLAIKELKKQSKLPTGTAAAKLLAGIEGRKKKEPESKEQEQQAKARVSDDAKRLGIHRVK
jgi:hypothetical protein